MARIQHTDCGPAQSLARAAVDLSYELGSRGNSVTVRWTPAHQGVEGNERADAWARRAAGKEEELADPAYLREASLAHLTRVSTEARSNSTGEWIRNHAKRGHRYRPPPGGRMCKELGKVRKELAGRFYQLLSGHAGTAPHLQRFGQTPSDKYWWCGTGERQTFSSGAGDGLPRSNDYGRELRGTASGLPGPPQSASSSETHARRRQCWIF